MLIEPSRTLDITDPVPCERGLKQGLKTQYFVILKKYTERITIAVLL